MPKINHSTNRRRIAAGRSAFQTYCVILNLPPIERKQDYSITDAVTDLLHYAVSKGFDPFEILRDAGSHLGAETIESCPKCGDQVTREDAYVDYGQGVEAGRTFYYCSERCRETH